MKKTPLFESIQDVESFARHAFDDGVRSTMEGDDLPYDDADDVNHPLRHDVIAELWYEGFVPVSNRRAMEPFLEFDKDRFREVCRSDGVAWARENISPDLLRIDPPSACSDERPAEQEKTLRDDTPEVARG